MPPTKPMPLQSRLLASLPAACLLLILSILTQPRNHVQATDIPLVAAHIEHVAPEALLPAGGEMIGPGDSLDGGDDGNYLGDFAYFDRGLIGRAVPDGAVALKDGEKADMESGKNQTKWFVLEKSELQRKRSILYAHLSERASGYVENSDVDASIHARQSDEETQVYISVNTCRQPQPRTRLVTETPPALTLYISNSTRNRKPGPGAENDLVTDPIPLASGAASFNLSATSDIYIGVSAPSIDSTWQGSFQYEVAASTTGFYHSYNGTDPYLWLIDTDSDSALFITQNLTTNPHNQTANQKWMKVTEVPFTMYAFPVGSWGATGLEHSYCGIKEAFEGNSTRVNVQKSMTDRYGSDGAGLPKGQFHVEGLQRNQAYTGFLVMDGSIPTDGLDLSQINPRVGRGGLVWRQFNWTTKADDSCQVIFDLPFCSSIAYAVPSSPQYRTNTSGLINLYDSQARRYYDNFAKSLAQVACNTTSTAQYSLARTCADCDRDYRTWLCSVLIPRCEPWEARDPWLVERNINAPFPDGTTPYGANTSAAFRKEKGDRWAFNYSRNPMIDDEIRPGPYKELLPCEDLCFDIVRSCPAQLQFACPGDKMRALQYGKRGGQDGVEGFDPRELRCNFPGAVKSLNTLRAGASTLYARAWWWMGVGMGVLVAIVAEWV